MNFIQSEPVKLPLTMHQLRIKNYIEKYTKQNGYCPTRREIADHFNCTFQNIQDMLNKMQAKGHIEIKQKTARAIRLL